MNVTFEISEDLFVYVLDENQNLFCSAGPFADDESANDWGNAMIERAKVGALIPDGGNDETENP